MISRLLPVSQILIRLVMGKLLHEKPKDLNRETVAQEGESGILVEGQNCMRIAHARRAAFLIDADSYFVSFTQAVERASKSIFIIGWDLDSRISLQRNNKGPSNTLIDFLNKTVARRRGLHAYVLIWDFAMIYAFEREPLPVYSVGWRTHGRVHFRLDGNHPLGASHHQKIVVIDDSIAFVGGLDLTKCRWDTPEHLPVDPRRHDPWCGYYSPFHDVQMAVDGGPRLHWEKSPESDGVEPPARKSLFLILSQAIPGPQP